MHCLNHLKFICFLVIINSALFAQQGDTLMGYTFAAANTYQFNWLDIQTEIMNTTSGANIAGTQQGQSSYDRVNGRYFIKGYGIAVIDAKNGSLITTVNNVTGMNNFEYDEGCNCLVGPETQGGATFTRVDITTGVKTVVAPLQANGLVWSESAFDRINRRYIFKSLNGVQMIDSLGNVLAPISTQLSGIEYDDSLNAVFGTYVTGSNRIFARLDLATAQVTTLSILPTATYYGGENTYDQTNHRYFAKTTLGLAVVDALTGNLIKTITSVGALMAIEYANFVKPKGPDPVDTGVRDDENNASTVYLYPNPNPGQFSFRDLPVGSKVEIFNSSGILICKLRVSDPLLDVYLQNKEKGLYTYRVTTDKQVVLNGKFVID